MIETYVVFVGGQERESPWGVRKGTPEEGPEPGLLSLGKSFNIPGAQCPKLLCGKTKPSFMEVRMK